MPIRTRATSGIDFYKTGHVAQYPAGLQNVYANCTPRNPKYLAQRLWTEFSGKAVFVGFQLVMQGTLIEHWNDTFFKLPKELALNHYRRRCDKALGAGAVNADNLSRLHDLGYLPLYIKALPEGSRVNARVPFWTTRVSDGHDAQNFGWLVNFVEDQLSAETWKTIVNATIAYEIRRMLIRFAEETGGDPAFTLWQGHDFSLRGMSGLMDAAMSSVGPLFSFLGSDTVPAFDALEDYYPMPDPDAPNAVLGGSIPATEHSVMCINGMTDELGTYRRLLTEVYPSGPVSIVSDTWDYWYVLTVILPELKGIIMGRQPNEYGLCKTVIRPDSGDPVKIVIGEAYPCTADMVKKFSLSGLSFLAQQEGFNYFRTGQGDDVTYYKALGDDDYAVLREEEITPAIIGSMELLWNTFGGTENSKGYRMLDQHIGIIYGDGITFATAHRILTLLKQLGFASTCIVFGFGSYTYQPGTRDDLGIAIKATFAVVNDVGIELQKDPITDTSGKKSARGLLRVERTGEDYDDFVLYEQQTWEQEAGGELEPTFCNSKMLRYHNYMEVRERLWKGRFFDSSAY